MTPVISISLLLIALSAVAYVVNNVISMRNARKNFNPSTYTKIFTEQFKNTKGEYLVTKVWYKDGHKSSEVLTADSSADAYCKQSDDRRNLDYYIESVYKMM